MKIAKVHHVGKNELLKLIKKVSMLTNPEIYPYKNAFVSLEKISTDYLKPAQTYVLADELKKVRELKWALSEHGIDIYQLDGYIKMWLEDELHPIDVLPPVVEESIEADGSIANIVNDGMHRVFMARLDHVIPQVVFVRGAPKELPYYAFPIPDGWDKVNIVEDLPEGFIKKWHRIRNYKSLYRNYNSAFENVGGPRGHFKKERGK